MPIRTAQEKNDASAFHSLKADVIYSRMPNMAVIKHLVFGFPFCKIFSQIDGVFQMGET